MKSWIERVRNIISRLVQKITADGIYSMAASLAYSTLLALVPIFTLSLSILTRLDFFKSIQSRVQQTLFEFFIPAQATIVMQYVEKFSINLSKLNTISIIGFLLTGVFLMITLEDSLNRIWRTASRKGWIVKVLIYWAVLTLGPILIAASFYLSSKYLYPAAGAAHPFLVSIFPFLSSLVLNTTLIFMMYHFMPNAKLKWFNSFISAFITGLVFEIFKSGLSLYLRSLNYEKIYGSIAALPLFLLWLYMVWLLLIFGAELAYILQNPQKISKERSLLPSWAIQLDILEKVLTYFQNDTPLFSTRLKHLYSSEVQEDIDINLKAMIEHGWVLVHESRGIIPARHPDAFASPRLYAEWLGCEQLPDELKESEWYRRFIHTLENTELFPKSH